jgi:hypothetical protein
MSDLDRCTCCPVGGANVRRDSMRQSNWCIAMSIWTGSFSGDVTGNYIGG